MSGTNKFSTPTYSEEILNYKELVANKEAKYQSSQGRDRYLAGKLAACYRADLIDLVFGIHKIVRTFRSEGVCVCGLRVPDHLATDNYPAYLRTPGHLDANEEPTRIF